jgi:hypothetical protein
MHGVLSDRGGPQNDARSPTGDLLYASVWATGPFHGHHTMEKGAQMALLLCIPFHFLATPSGAQAVEIVT